MDKNAITKALKDVSAETFAELICKAYPASKHEEFVRMIRGMERSRVIEEANAIADKINGLRGSDLTHANYSTLCAKWYRLNDKIDRLEDGGTKGKGRKGHGQET